MLVTAAAPPLFLVGFGAAPPFSTAVEFTTIASVDFKSSSSISSYGLKGRKRRALLWCSCVPENGHLEGFSMISQDIPWNAESTWSTFAAYFFICHIPLSFGGLSIVRHILHKSDLDPVTMAASALALQATELGGFLILLYHTANNGVELPSFFLGTRGGSEKRCWLKAAAAGIGFLLVLVFITSVLSDRLIGPKDVNNPILKEILLYNPISKTACFVIYCFVAPLVEETVYRGFLLTSIASGRKCWQAICISSIAFSFSHFSPENSLQLFIIGCVLGSVYCWSGKLAAPITVHSAYNAIILLITNIS